MTNEAMTAVERLEEAFWHECASVADLDTSRHAVRKAIQFTLARQSVGVEEIVRHAYEEGVEDGIGWHCYPESGPQPQWIDSVARVNVLSRLTRETL